jgi:hypothetical protein
MERGKNVKRYLFCSIIRIHRDWAVVHKNTENAGDKIIIHSVFSTREFERIIVVEDV